MSNKFEEFLKGQTPEVQAVMREFPPGTVFADDKGEGLRLYVVGVGEPKSGNMEDMAVFLSLTDPADDYEKAVKDAHPVLASRLREAQRKSNGVQ